MCLRVSLITAGKGKVVYASSEGVSEQYDGDWVAGKMHGWGKYCYSDGSVYEGEFANGKVPEGCQ